MSVRHDAIGLDCRGIDLETRHHWAFDATAFKQPEGYFFANKSEDIDGVEYEHSIYILRVKEEFDECEIEGFWYQRNREEGPTIWRFSGSLNPF